MNDVLIALLAGAGFALLVVGFLQRKREQEDDLALILDLPYGEQDVAVESVSETRGTLVEGTVSLAGRMVDQLDAAGTLAVELERARIPLRAGEYVVVAASSGIVAACVLQLVTGQFLFAVVALVATPFLSWALVKRRIRRRKKKFETQLPGAMTLIAGSLGAGHTFLRSIQLMCEEAEAPLSEEFRRVVDETRLGDPVVDALERMAFRLDIRDLHWVVQAIRIQQTVGGKLGDLLHTLADFIYAREDVRREVDVLTAEGRISAWVLGALPVFLLFAIQVISPGYMKPMFQGAGYWILGATGLSVLAGVWVILRMVKIDV
ncbi:MAG: pilus assembly protein CpaF [Actinomycetota bacterium]|jgi:tight adherence protein B|nr:pilus assembly protein CpaF [Actinomycetota bacterium]